MTRVCSGGLLVRLQEKIAVLSGGAVR